MPWVSRLLRGDRVWVKAGPAGEPTAGADGRVDILYKKGGKVYRASLRNLTADPHPVALPDEEGAPAGAAADGPKPRKHTASPTSSHAEPHAHGRLPDDAVIVYTDGACTGNPGPMGLGVVIVDGKKRKELSEYLGVGTNNIAELTAIERALEHCPRDRTVVVHSDSAYALGLLGKNWKAKANQELVARLRKLAAEFEDVRWVKVRGHSGVPENERCDELATGAIANKR
jgi:ribonuclease HI